MEVDIDAAYNNYAALTDEEKNTIRVLMDGPAKVIISKIFGELITIIENDKRGTEVTLAYSGEQFSVPSNVFIIGTMNTADQSLTHIDAALKRRFSSIEVMPDSSILEKGMIGLPELLDKINEKIREKISRDNQIGHSYFMTEDGNNKVYYWVNWTEKRVNLDLILSGNKSEYFGENLFDKNLANKELQYITEISVAHHFQSIGLHNKLLRMFMAEILSKVLIDGEKNPSIFNFIWVLTKDLDNEKEIDHNFSLRYLISLTKFLGFFPSTENIEYPFFKW